jgi:hexosaminidase
MKAFLRRISLIILFLAINCVAFSQQKTQDKFPVRGFHLDLRVQAMTMDALKQLATKLHEAGLNTLIMEWEGTYPFKKHPMISNQNAYTPEQISSFVKFCNDLGINVIPLQQSFGHVEYILRNYRYQALREDQKDYSQVCPVEETLNKALFTDLFADVAASHNSPYVHIGGDETYLLGHCPKCIKRVAEVGKSRLYIDHIKMLCDIVIGLGKKPVLWADIALKYPDAIALLPKGTVFIDWNYGWEVNRFGDHEKLLKSGYEVWGSPSLRSNPDNFYITQWEKHFKNIKDFVPAAAQFGYKGIIMTSWSTSGIYSPVFISHSDIVDLYAIRHVYPLSGFNILMAAFTASLKRTGPLDINEFIRSYTEKNYGFDAGQASKFWTALTKAPYDVAQGKVISPVRMSVKDLRDSAMFSVQLFNELNPVRGQNEFEHYRLMAAIRLFYLDYLLIEQEANSENFERSNIPKLMSRLKQLKEQQSILNEKFISLNGNFLLPAEVEQENQLRNAKIDLLYKRLAGQQI